MWRQSALPGDEEDDRSFSEEEEEDDEALDHLANDRGCGSDRSCHRPRGKEVMNLGFPSSDNGIRIQRVFDSERACLQSSPKEERRSDSADDSISDEETLLPTKLSFARGVPKPHENCYSVEKERHKGASTWSEALEEANELACLRTNLSRRGRGRAKPKFSIHTHSCESSLSRFKDKNDKCYEGSSRRHISHPIMSEHPRPEMFENVDEEIDEHPLELVTPEMRGALPSMAEMLEDLQEKNGISNRSTSLKLLHNVKMKEKRTTSFGRTILLNLGDRVNDDEDPLEYVDGGASAEDEDVDQQDSNMARQKIRGQTMTDLFQDAFTASALEEPMVHAAKFSGAGYYRSLQRVMQIEKDRHLEFLKQSHGGQSSSNDLRGITVQILSRCLEGKLTVCHCSFEEDTECSSVVKGPIECVVDGGTVKRTVIFSSKICDNVDIEVGKFIRIYPPWKEVLVKEDDKVILCTYFSNVMA